MIHSIYLVTQLHTGNHCVSVLGGRNHCLSVLGGGNHCLYALAYNCDSFSQAGSPGSSGVTNRNLNDTTQSDHQRSLGGELRT